MKLWNYKIWIKFSYKFSFIFSKFLMKILTNEANKLLIN
jgi:hypothetical protein